MKRNITLFIMTVATLVVAALVWFDFLPSLRGPAGGSWRWAFQPKPAAGLMGPAIRSALILIVLMILSGTRWAARRPRWAANLLLLGTFVFGFSFQLGLMKPVTDAPITASLVRRTADNYFTSYFSVAASPSCSDPADFLAHHDEWLARTDLYFYLHAVTHPPGGVLFYRSVIALCDAFPTLTNCLHERIEQVGVKRAEFNPTLEDPQLAAALLASWLLILLNVVSCWPIAWCVRQLGNDPVDAARIAALWVLLPGSALMTAQLDPAITLPFMLGVGGMIAAFRAGRHAVALAFSILAGVCAGIALQLTYGAAAFLAIGFATTLHSAHDPNRERKLAQVIPTVLLTAAFLILLPALWGHHPIRAFMRALSNHHAITQDRGYFVWIPFNALDFALFLGIPLCIAAALRFTEAGGETATLSRGRRFLNASCMGIALLILSGTVRGEVGRIWSPLMPLFLIAALTTSAEPKSEDSAQSLLDSRAIYAAHLGFLLAILDIAFRLRWQVP